MNRRRLADDLIGFEGAIRNHDGDHMPYEDTRGVQTIGYGHRVDNGITEAAARVILEADIATAERNVPVLFPAAHLLDAVRQEVIVQMMFQLGLRGFGKFVQFRAAVLAQDWERAADEILDSDAARESGRRWRVLARWMRDGTRED